MRITMILPLLCGALTAGGLFGACSKDDDGGGIDPRCSEENAHYEGYATDETCLTMYDAEDGDAIQLGGANAPVLLNPTNGQVVAVTVTSLTITWDTPLDTDTSFARRAAPPPSRADLWRNVLSDLSPVSTAWAHLPPVTGAIHMVRLKGIEGHGGVATYFTSLQFLILTGHGLEHVTGAPTGEVAIEITSMYVNDNRILTPSDGPFRPATDTTFTVE